MVAAAAEVAEVFHPSSLMEIEMLRDLSDSAEK